MIPLHHPQYKIHILFMGHFGFLILLQHLGCHINWPNLCQCIETSAKLLVKFVQYKRPHLTGNANHIFLKYNQAVEA